MTETAHEVLTGDCLDLMRLMPDDSVDLVITSPPYENAREYGELEFSLRSQAWVDWAVIRYRECVRVSRGLVAWVVEGKTSKFQWSATPALMMADLHRAGVKLRKPPIYKRYGIPGSGGPEWLKNNYELIVCSSKGRLPWADNTVMGHPPKCGVGGAMSNRHKDGRRANDDHNRGRKHVERREATGYKQPKLANPGNIIDCGAVGGNNIGSKLAHQNAAPFPERIPEFFIRSFSPEGGVVLDCFSGSGTTAAVAKRFGRSSLSIDVRLSQASLTQERIDEVVVDDQ